MNDAAEEQVATNLQLESNFVDRASFYTDRFESDNYKQFSKEQRSDLDFLTTMARQLYSRNDSNTQYLALLDKYNDHVGYPRQILWDVVISGRPYKTSDLPYL